MTCTLLPLRDNGMTYGTPTWIWSVVVDGNLYARAYNGTASSWYRAATRQKTGQITAAGRTWNVVFSQADDRLTEQINQAYRAKYGSSPYLGSMTGVKAQAATVLISPAEK